MKKHLKYIWFLLLLFFAAGLYSSSAGDYVSGRPLADLFAQEPQDTLPKSRYPVSKTQPEVYDDLKERPPLDLRDPENVKTTVEYDLKTGLYIVRTKVGDSEIGTPISLTPEEFQNYSLQESMNSYFREKNTEEYLKGMDKDVNLTDIQFGLGAAERIFGPGGVRVTTQGSAEVTMGLKTSKTENPTLTERARNRTFFNFDENVQLNMQATVGTKVNFGMNYNTETSFDFDQKKLKLAYTGEEDEIIKNIEAGNVSMTTNNSLINGGAALFGIKADLQFGKLRVNTLFAQQQSESQTVNSKGGAQTKEFELKIDEYDENRHFFLSHYFRDIFDKAMSKLPLVQAGIKINKIEVWITNKRANYDQSRNIVAFADIGEASREHIHNSTVQPSTSSSYPQNNANTLYSQMNTAPYSQARDISKVTSAFSDGIYAGGLDYEKVESARLLDGSEYTVNTELGYISLKTQLQADEVLAVAFDYTYAGQTYQVGEFSSDNTENTAATLYLKLLKGTTTSPAMPFWNLMMKNVYALPNAYSVQKEKFKLDILYQSDTTGTYVNYISEGNIKDQILLRVMNLDRLDSRNEPYADGIFDFLSGYTVLTDNGRIVFPVVEPFGSHLREKIGNDAIANKYVFEELYDSTLTYARQLAEKNKFLLRGEYKASSGSEIQLGAMNVARGSVKVTAGGVVLTENTDYTVDYTAGVVTILNESIIAAGTPISVSLENQSNLSMQRKTMVGLDLNYQFTPNFNIGATVMHLSEMPLTTKTAFGSESVNNTLWGLNLSYKGESQWLTNMLDKIPLLELTKPSQISFNAEFAHLIAGHYEDGETGKYSYLDDFESTQSGYDLLNPYPWTLSSVPFEPGGAGLFPEASLTDNIDYGKNRALMAWYYIDGLFTRPKSGSRPNYMSLDDISNHYVRQVPYTELFPNKDIGYNEDNIISVLNVAYYPKERGPYNLDVDYVNPDGTLMNPEKRFGGMMRKIDQTDFETANIEYIEFWLLDPFIYNPDGEGGDLYFNLGEISEDILKDGKKFFENGLPIDGDTSKVSKTVWGHVPKQQSTVNGFDNTAGAREKQDVGFNGLSSAQELEYPTYQEFLTKLEAKLSADTLQKMKADPLSVFANPSGDLFHYYRGSDYDQQEADILTRYKRYNGTEGNSKDSESSSERYATSSKTVPDIEDLNQDNTLNENEKYFEYKVSLRPKDLVVGSNYIVDEQRRSVKTANGDTSTVSWYQFKVPVKEYKRAIGGISDFKSIRFMRLFMTDFKEETILRFGTFQLVRGEWRTYTQDLSNPNLPSSGHGTLDVSTVNIEENGSRVPVNYVLPPGVSRMLDPSQPQLRQQNEQALSLKVTNLDAMDSRAVYKTTSYDLRMYKRLQMFVHAEKFINDATDLSNGNLSVFIRLGSDYKNNYYEYEVPLILTPHRTYSSNSLADQRAVWPDENMIDFATEVLTNLKLNRNKAKREGVSSVGFNSIYSEYDPNNTRNTVSIIGNPSLSEVKTIMIGVRNNSKDIKSGEIWVNELRLSDFDEGGGWAAKSNLNVALSDLGTVNLGGHIETAGFGALDQSVSERRLDDYKQFNVATTIELGKFFPEKAQVSIPLYYAYSKETYSPKYDPLDQDIKLKDKLETLSTSAEKDSVKNLSNDVLTTTSFALNNVRVNIKSKTPMPYDPANFTLGYSYSQTKNTNPETTYETTTDQRWNFGYSYSPYVKPFQPFAKMESNKGARRYLKQFSLNYLPSNISFQSDISRNYYEIQLRDLSEYGVSNLPVSFSETFLWDRRIGINWNLTNNLMFSFQSNTNARIETPHVQVNKELNPDDYEVWKDSVKQSLRDLGTPLTYDQTFTATFNVPFQYFPFLDWANGSIGYNATYNWERGAMLEADLESELGNAIRNQRNIDFQGNFNFINLYNKSAYLKKINQKFTPSAQSRQRQEPPKPRPKPKVEKEVQLSMDSAVVVTHNMMSKKVRVTAKREDGRTYRIKYKELDYSKIRITTRDSVKLKLTIAPGPPPTETFVTKFLEYTSRFAMSLRRINIQYKVTDGMYVPGFRPNIGDWFGQGSTAGGTAPGLGFAFGQVSRSYIDDALEKNWLVIDENLTTPAMINSSKTFAIRANFEPVMGLKIDLNANRLDSRDTEIYFMNDGSPEQYGGSFTMTTVAIGTAFKSSGDLNNNYYSETFEKFRQNRGIIAERIMNKYAGTNYPTTGFFQGTTIAGQPFDPSTSKISENSTDVLIPAFLAAYTGKDANKISLSPFPSIASLLPNWKITYDGLGTLNIVKKYFKNVTLSHQYTCLYTVGTFSSFLNWVDAGLDGLGYVRSVANGNPTPSSPYDISAVSLTETFSPLFGVDATLLNDVTTSFKIQRTRNLNLNISSFQLVESLSNEFVIGLGYKYADFNKVLRMKKKNDFSNDLTVRLDFSYRKMQSLIRKIADSSTQATSGNVAKTLQFSADYAFSKALTLRGFYDLQINNPLVSSASYPTSNSSYGISLRISLAQ